MTITNNSVFRSTDQDAGVLATRGRCSGTVGDGLALLNMLLLNGYNWQEIVNPNLTFTGGGIGSVVLAAHGFNADQRLWLLGAVESGYNSDAIYPVITSLGVFGITTTGSPSTPATTPGSTTLNGAIASTTATSIPVTNGALLNGAGNFPIKVDSEYMLVTGGQGTNTLTVVRGFANSTPATHLTLATVAGKVMVGVAPAGGFNHWTADFTATNKSTFRPPAGNRFYIDCDDTNTTYMLLRGFETMSAVGTGTGSFPTTAQLANPNACFTKSASASTAARSWVAIATDRMLALVSDVNSSAFTFTSSTGQFFFGDLINQSKSGDAYATLLMTEGSQGSAGSISTLPIYTSTITNGHFLPRSYTQLGTALQCGKMALDNRGNQTTSASGGAGGLTYPHPPDGGLYLSQWFVNEGSTAIFRGIIPGLWGIMHAKPAQMGDTWLGTGTFAGKKFMAVNVYTNYQVAFEISNTIQGT